MPNIRQADVGELTRPTFLGNLTRRTDVAQSLEEHFVFDNLNRITQTQTTIAGTTTNVSLTYDHRGNILSKSDIGSYTVGTVAASCSAGAFAGPHATSAISSAGGGSKDAEYCYDANGNMTSGDGRTVTYTAFDKPSQIQRGTNIVTFGYGPGRARYKRIDETLTGTTTTFYAAGRSYEHIAKGVVVTEKFYIGDFAVVTKTLTTGSETTETSYLHRDHLGSIDAITDASGQVVQRMSFDSWGRRRETNWTAFINDAPILTFNSMITTRGYLFACPPSAGRPRNGRSHKVPRI